MAQQKHPIEVVANQAATELGADSPFMGGLKSMIWGNSAPYSKDVSKSEAMDMYQAEMSTPEGRAGLVTRYGQQKASEIEQELIQDGRLPGASIPDPQETMA